MKRFIEVDFPIKEVSAESAKEKNIRHGHICTLHIWWARRPLASSRASIYAALTPAPKTEKEKKEKLKFIAELSKWENSLNEILINKAREDIKKAFNGETPKVLDCFAGGGAIPLEALRLGCETYASDLNPVATLILKATLEYPQKYGKPYKIEGQESPETLFPEMEQQKRLDFESKEIPNRLLHDVKKWGNWVFEEAKKEIERFYPPDSDGSIPVGYIWARTVKCQNPSCGVEIPLMRQFWLAKKDRKKVALKMLVDKRAKKIDFKTVEGKEIDFDPSVGTTRRATVLCPICGGGIDDRTLRREFKEGRSSERMVAVVRRQPGRSGKSYRIAAHKDVGIFKEAKKYEENKRQELEEKWGFDPVPDEEIPTTMPGGIHTPTYGMTKWGDLFNYRQKLALITFAEKVRQAHVIMLSEGIEEEYAKNMASYLALGLDRLAIYQTTLGYWHNTRELINPAMGRQALAMTWDYAEGNPIGGNADWNSAMDWISKVVGHCSQCGSPATSIVQTSATALPFANNFFDAVISDPPYYSSVTYADLSDFFYVWLKRIVGNLYAELFSTPLTPKSDEIIEKQFWDKTSKQDKAWYENMMRKAFDEMIRVLKPEGIACIVFAHRSVEAWEAIINALVASGLYLVGSWPVHTEMKERLMAKESAALASSIYMVCRKRTDTDTAFFNEIKPKIEQRIREKLDQFWNEGIGGSDFFVSAIGPAVEVFGKYSKVEKLSGEELTVKELLEHVRKVVSEFALERIIKRPDLGGVDHETRFYLLWRWTYNSAKINFDDARKLSQAVGLELTEHWDKGGIIKKEKESISVVGPLERAKSDGFLKKERYATMVDTLHACLIHWSKANRKKIQEVLAESGYAGNETFWQVAQAISEVLPEGDKEKQLLQGFLYGKQTYAGEAEKESVSGKQQKIFE